MLFQRIKNIRKYDENGVVKQLDDEKTYLERNLEVIKLTPFE